MKQFMDFLRKERLYILLLIFVMLVNVIIILHDNRTDKAKGKTQVVSPVQKPQQEAELKKAKAAKIFAEKKYLGVLFTIASLLILLFLFLGLAMDLVFISLRLAGKKINMFTYKLQTVKWNLWDVARVAILFSFFGYMLVMIESCLVRVFPIIKSDNFRMVINTSLLDALTIVFILYFTVTQYKEKLIALGISFKHFFRNIFYGIMSYVAIAPVLLAILIGTSIFTNLIHYVPQEQPVVKLFLKEQNTRFLIYTTLFASVVGPMIEELFFRGFMYNAFKRHIGIFWSAVITAGIFACLHVHAVGFLPIMVLGLLLAYLYEKTGTLVASMTVHIMHNLSMLLLVLLVKQIQ